MNEQKFAGRLGVGYILGQSAIFALIWIMVPLGGLTFEHAATAAAIILPPLVGYGVLILTSLRKQTATTGTINGVNMFLAVFITGFFFAALIAGILAYVLHKGFETMFQFEFYLALMDGAFAGYMSAIIKPLFKE